MTNAQGMSIPTDTGVILSWWLDQQDTNKTVQTSGLLTQVKKIDGSNRKSALLICVHSLIVINCEMPQIPIIKSVNSFAVTGRHIPLCISSTSNSRTTRSFYCMYKKDLNILFGMTFQTVTCLYPKWTENGSKLELLAQICPSSQSTKAIPPRPGHFSLVSFVCYTVLRYS